MRRKTKGPWEKSYPRTPQRDAEANKPLEKEEASASHLATVSISSLHLNSVGLPSFNGRQLEFDCHVHSASGARKASLMTDTGASALGFVDSNFVKLHKLSTIALTKPIRLRLAGDTSAPNITHLAQVKFQLGDHVEELWCLMTALGPFDIIVGWPWVEQHGVTISGKAQALIFDSDECLRNCNLNHKSTMVHARGVRLREAPRTPAIDYGADIAEISASAFWKMASQDKNQVIAMWPEHFRILDKPEENDKYLLCSSFVTDVAVIIAEDYEKFFNKAKKVPITPKQLKERVPTEFHEYIDRWDPKEADKVPPHREWDHRIDLVPDARAPAKKAYGLSRDQATVVKKYVDDMLGKGFIRHSTSDFATPVLLVKKPEGGLRVCVDYRALNALTIKNRNAPPLIRETLARLYAAKIYSKFDIIAAFNEIRVREGDEEKTAFLTRYGLFEYVVMPFGLCNAPGTFQAFINATLREYLDDFCTAYVDDILIYSNSKEEHVEHVRKVLAKLRQVGLFLDIDKCEFFVTEVKYLGLIITTHGVKMDPKKVDAIVNWKSPRCLKDVQAFLGFANFYRRFIYGYSRLAGPLTSLMKTLHKGFTFPWNPDGPEEKAFQELKIAFSTAPVLLHFDPDKETWIETDASDYVVAGILSQIGPDGKLHPVAFMSKKMSPAECNYEIYDKELLAIVRAFEEWRPECAGTPVEDPIKILTDHKNLEHFMSSKQLNRRQARWAEFLSELNFKITYRPGVQGTKPDSLTRRSEDLPEDNNDERKKYNCITLLKDKNLDEGVRNAIKLAPMLMDESLQTVTRLARY